MLHIKIDFEKIDYMDESWIKNMFDTFMDTIKKENKKCKIFNEKQKCKYLEFINVNDEIKNKMEEYLEKIGVICEV